MNTDYNALSGGGNHMETYYFADEELWDDIYGEAPVQCLPESVVERLSEKCDCNLFDNMHEATDEELEKYPYLND